MVIIKEPVCPSVRDTEGNLTTSVRAKRLGFNSEAPGHSDSWLKKQASFEHTRRGLAHKSGATAFFSELGNKVRVELAERFTRALYPSEWCL